MRNRGPCYAQRRWRDVTGGTHGWAVFVNRADVGVTVLISDNIAFVLP